MKTQQLDSILKKHGIHSKFRTEFRAVVTHGKRPSKELLTRLDCVANYKAALDEVRVELSKSVRHKFPPPITHYESLDLETVAR